MTPPDGRADSSGLRNPRAWSVVALLAPVLLLFYLYRDGLHCWFIADDFAWLGLLRQYNSNSDLPSLLFAPAAQGTIRPWSERGFFLLFHMLFGLDNLPFRIAAFVTMSLNVVLVGWLTRRMTGSLLAGFLAAVLWSANSALVTPMSWSSSYNELLCPLFLLSALALFVRFVESGRWVFWWAQLLVFVLGFGALEINVVYPALAAAWVLFIAPEARRRALLLSQVPLFVLSVAYFAVHRAVVPFPSSGAYALHVDWRLFKTIGVYGKWSLLPQNWLLYGHSRLWGNFILASCLILILALLISETRLGRRPVWFGIAWYLACLAPVLPLPDHHTDYYLSIPMIGLSMAVAYGFVCARKTDAWRSAAAVAILLYLSGMIPVSRGASHWWRQRTAEVRTLVLGVEAAHQTHPKKTIVLDGVPSSLYGDSIGQGALYAAGLDNVYLTPGSERDLPSDPDLEDPQKTVLDPAVMLKGLNTEGIVVYSLAGDHLRNITAAYERSAPDRFPELAGNKVDPLPARVDVGNPLYSWLLGKGWLSLEADHRWMTAQASVRIKIPKTGNKLLLEGNFTEEQLKQGTRHLVVTAAWDGAGSPGGTVPIGETRISDPETDFRRLFSLPSSVIGKDDVEIQIHVDPVMRKHGQEYGAVFGKLAILP